MRRADRLFRLVELLRSRRHATGQWLAEQLGVSLRTLYRDIRDLSLSGVPIEGEAGVGHQGCGRSDNRDAEPLSDHRQQSAASNVDSADRRRWPAPRKPHDDMVMDLWPCSALPDKKGFFGEVVP